MLQPKSYSLFVLVITSTFYLSILTTPTSTLAFASKTLANTFQDDKKQDDKKQDDKKQDDKKQDETKKDDGAKTDSKSDEKKAAGDKKQDDPKSGTESKADPDGKKAGTESGQPEKKSDHPVDQLMEEWNTMRTSLIDARKRHVESINKEEIEAAEKEFMDLYDKALAQIETIKTTALEQIAKDPNDEVSNKALAGILIHLANQDDQDVACFELAEKMAAANVPVKFFQNAKEAPRLSLFNKKIFDEINLRQIEALSDDLPRVKITTDKGELVVELFENQAPETVGNFISLVKSKFYEGSPFYRVLNDFMAQGGGAGKDKDEVKYKIYCECVKADPRLHYTGSLSMAHGGRNTGSSEFFITFKKTSFLDMNHTVFGRVIEGMDVLEKITRTFESVIDPATGQNREIPIKDAKPTLIQKMEVIRDRGHEYKPNKVTDDRPANNPKVDPVKNKDGDKKK